MPTPSDDSAEVLATGEQMLLHIDSKAGKAVPAPPEILAKAKSIAEAHASLPAPDGAGRHVGQKKQG